MSERLYTVRYVAGPYSGTVRVVADDDEVALAKARAKVRRSMTLPMYSDTYEIDEVQDA